MRYDIQRAGMMKRIAAWVLDAILFFTLLVGAFTGFSALFKLDNRALEMHQIYETYQETYKIDFTISPEAYEKLTEAEKQVYEDAQKALAEDPKAKKAYEDFLYGTLAMVTLSFLVTYLILEFGVPLLLKNGQTVGKKVFSLALMRTDGIKVSTFMLFVRAIIGKYTLETMVPVAILVMLLFGTVGTLGLIIIGLILLLQIVILVKTRNNLVIHDLLACTVVVDYSSQMIFDTPEALHEYEERLREDFESRAD